MKLPGKSVARLLKPVNLDEAERRFHESGSSPELKYASDVSAVFKQNSEVDFSLERLAELIINQPDSSADDHPLVTGNELLKAMKEYVQLLDLEHIVIFRQTLNALALANVLKPGSLDRKLIVHYNPEATLPLSLVPGVCAHELGTHLLRMINDDLQVWRKAGRKKYRLSCHMATEEGLATLNTLVASNERSLRHSALNYWAVCQAAKISFTNLYHKLAAYMPDANKRFRLCIRVKRGLVHTDKPGACTLDQNYFLGAVDILRNLESTDLRLLYCGQIARVDLPRLKPVLTMRQVRLPPFLATPEAYRTHVRCLLMIRELNGIDAVSSVPRPLAEQVIDDDVK